MKQHLLLACVAFASAIGMAAAAPPESARVVAVIDGDTLSVLDAANRQQRLRLAGIDAPECWQPFGTKAGDHQGSLTMRRADSQIDWENGTR